MILIILCSCSNERQNKSNSISNPTDSSTIISVDKESSKFSLYEKRYKTAVGIEKKFLSQMIPIIKKFSNSTLDTVIIQHCKLSSLIGEAILKTRIFENSDTIYEHTDLIKDNKILWSFDLKNPYLWINDSKLYQFDTRDKWVTFTIAILYGIPEIQNIKNFNFSDISDFVIEFGLEDIRKSGKNMNKENYKKYLDEYHGDLITIGDPECREGIFIWCDEVGKLVLFYKD